ncbi:MAG: hypothetical protein OEQ39_24775 [Gammaproteobacteria bacterium]|nr:hypothetical protein [Gammaproteobacteria bacterium]MDH3380149.1 hypothetical protein [Gammaproteobacteria bacterium]
MASIIERNALKAASRFSAGVPTGNVVNPASSGQKVSAGQINWVTNFVTNFRVHGGQMNYSGQVATLSIYRQNPWGQATKASSSTIQISELWGLDVNGGTGPSWTQVSDGTGTITGFVSGTSYACVSATNAGVWNLVRQSSKPAPTASVDYWILAEIESVNNDITLIKQWWHGGMALYSMRV